MQHSKLIIGWETDCVPNINATLEKASEQKADFICAPLFHPRNKRDLSGVAGSRVKAASRSDMLLDSGSWTSLVVGKLSDWINLDDRCRRVSADSEAAFRQELQWATHLGVPAILMNCPEKPGPQFAQILTQAAASASYTQFWLRVKLNKPVKESETTSDISGWKAWNFVRCLSDGLPAIGVALEIDGDLPSAEEIERWMGEPLKALILSTSIFLTNKKGYPTLSVRHQKLLLQFMKLKPHIVLKGSSRYEKGILYYIQYLEYLGTRRPPMARKDQFEAPYLDCLQVPLQPLMDNLESQTYETFEKDPTKYEQYEKAVRAALTDTPQEKTTVIMVVGAGRGPLVKASLRAANDAQRNIRVYAVEKNPNAIITLKNMHEMEQWGDAVTIVDSDMRVWDAKEKADILVSELLGSWGDNELSPECLDGAQRFLKDEGISIPCNYTSYAAPVTSMKLWNDVKAFKDLKHFETPYVVKLHNVFSIDQPQACFTFTHPNKDEPIDNRRYTHLTFHSKTEGLMHGLAGYFDSQLYGEHWISIHPETHTPGMFSWFSLFMPLQNPMAVREGSRIDVYLWRKVSLQYRKVWYEWAVTVDEVNISPIHNPGGRSYWIGL